MKRKGVLWGGLAALILGLAVLGMRHTTIRAGDEVPSPFPKAGAPVKLPKDATSAPPAPTAQPPHRETKSLGIDEMLSELAVLKARKAELAKAEKEMIAALREKLKHQKERMKKLGIDPEETQAPPTAISCTCTPVP